MRRLPVQAVLTPKERRLRLSIAVVPLAVFLIAMSARVIYLQVCIRATACAVVPHASRLSTVFHQSTSTCRVLMTALLLPTEAESNGDAALQKFFPELLWPTKERKARKKYRNKEKVGRRFACARVKLLILIGVCVQQERPVATAPSCQHRQVCISSWAATAM